MARSSTCFDHCDGPLPVPAGTSPYRIKGDFYRHLSETVTALEQKTAGRLGQLLEREGVRRFMAQPFLATVFYDNLPLPRVTMCIAELYDKDVLDLATRAGRHSAERNMEGVYSRMLSPLNTQSFAARFPRIIGFFYDYGEVAVTMGSDKKSAQAVRSGVPLAVAEWWCSVTIPFVRYPLEKNGARGLDIQFHIEATQADAQVPLGRCVWNMRWD